MDQKNSLLYNNQTMIIGEPTQTYPVDTNEPLLDIDQTAPETQLSEAEIERNRCATDILDAIYSYEEGDIDAEELVDFIREISVDHRYMVGGKDGMRSLSSTAGKSISPEAFKKKSDDLAERKQEIERLETGISVRQYKPSERARLINVLKGQKFNLPIESYIEKLTRAFEDGKEEYAYLLTIKVKASENADDIMRKRGLNPSALENATIENVLDSEEAADYIEFSNKAKLAGAACKRLGEPLLVAKKLLSMPELAEPDSYRDCIIAVLEQIAVTQDPRFQKDVERVIPILKIKKHEYADADAQFEKLQTNDSLKSTNRQQNFGVLLKNLKLALKPYLESN